MTDHLDKEIRSALMARIRGKHTKPELVVRRMAHGLGLRFRLHRKDLPGTPDLIFPSRKIAAFVHGCFWHRHPGCRRATGTRTRSDYWQAKFDRNVARDEKVKRQLELLEWRVITIWECETRDQSLLKARMDEIAQARPVRTAQINAVDTPRTG